MTFSEQLKLQFYTEAQEARADIASYQEEMSEVKQKAQAAGITLEEAESLSIYAQILEIGTSISLTALQFYERELTQIDLNPARYDQINPLEWALGLARGQREVEKWLKVA